MTGSRFEQPPPADVADVDSAVAARHETAPERLVGLALATSDPAPAARLCRDLLDDPDRRLAAVAATCLGHLARRFGHLDEQSFAALQDHRGNRAIGGRVRDALDDVAVFTGGSRAVTPSTGRPW